MRGAGGGALENPPGSPLGDALLAVELLAACVAAGTPQQMGGMCLRGGGPARDFLLDQLRALLPAGVPWRRLPGHVDDDALNGGTDIAASLAAGRLVRQRGLLAEVAGGVLVVPMAERLRGDIAGRIAQALDGGGSHVGGFALILLDDGLEGDDRPPPGLLERVGLRCDLAQVRAADLALARQAGAGAMRAAARARASQLGDDALAALAATAAALGIASLRPLLFAGHVARCHAALAGRDRVEQADLAAAVRLVLAPRTIRLPPQPPAEQAPPADDSPDNNASESDDADQPDDPGAIPEDLLIAAALAAIPPDVLEMIASGRAQRAASGGGSGRKTASKMRGRPLGARPGMPGGGVRLALVDSLRAAVPWQGLRQREDGDAATDRIRFRREDLRIRRFEERTPTVTIFCVDASGSAAMARLGEAKGAVELILAQAYVKRTEVALIAFRGSEAELLLPPTRSLTRAKRALSDLPGGGGTPLACGIALACQLGDAVKGKGRSPFFVFLTDGSANIATDGTPGRSRATADALAAARSMALARHDAVVIDISPRPRPDAAQLAAAMQARYLPLPMGDAKALQQAVTLASAPAEPTKKFAR